MDPSLLNPVPEDFGADVARAAANKCAGDLALLSYEVKGFEWESRGWRTVGEAQVDINALAAAKTTWENVRRLEPQDLEANLRIKTIYERLGDLKRTPKVPPGEKPAADPEHKRVLLFAGHMIDAENREKPRFPASKELVAREKIKEAILKEMNTGAGVSCAYAGAANGGDILFQEICAELGIPTRLYLAIPPAKYVNSSVIKAGPGWVDRFWNIYRKHEAAKQLRVLSAVEDAKSDEDYLPAWLRSKENYGIWQRNNLWMLFNALAEACDQKTADPSLTLIALWDGAEGDGPGGTGDLVEKVKKLGARHDIINTKQVFDL